MSGLSVCLGEKKAPNASISDAGGLCESVWPQKWQRQCERQCDPQCDNVTLETAATLATCIGACHGIAAGTEAARVGLPTTGAACRFHDSIEACETVLALNPLHFHCLAGKGICHEKIHQPSEAMACFRRALEINPHITSVQKKLQGMEKQQGQ